MSRALKRPLIARRVKVGAFSDEGRRLSLIDAMLDSLPLADDEVQRTNITEALAVAASEAEHIKACGTIWTLPKYAALAKANGLATFPDERGGRT
jgi:hypothetical protein